MRRGKRGVVVTALAAVAASAGAVVITAAPASAGANCASGYHCIFEFDVNDGSKYSFFNTDSDFRNNYYPSGYSVHNNSWAASNSSTGGYESHYYTGVGTDWGGFLFCVNPGSTVYESELPDSLEDRASSLRLRGTTQVRCY
ncbi:hypothetical protein HFP71_33240 [Streptomyces sp. ARC32]